MAALKRQEEEISCELLEIKELRDKAEAEKKKFIKTIKISYYYLEIFKEKDELVDFERLL